MLRTQISLTEKQAADLKRTAARQGVSMAAVIRDAVDRHLAAIDRRAAAMDAVGKFSSGHADTADRHDDALADLYTL